MYYFGLSELIKTLLENKWPFYEFFSLKNVSIENNGILSGIDIVT